MAQIQKTGEDSYGDVHDKISELISELGSCREDERNTQNQILQIILIAGTVLGLLFGASYLGIDDEKANYVFLEKLPINGVWFNKIVNHIMRNITPARLVFWLSILVFLVAFLYIINLGLQNILRYYYIQNIEDRLQDLLPNTIDNEQRGRFLHWNEYSAPIMTKNSRHITSTHTALGFFSYIIAVACAVSFSMGLVISLFLIIDPIRWFDTLLLVIMVGFMAVTFFSFLRSLNRGKEIQQYAWDTAHINQRIRLGEGYGEIYGKAKSFRRLMRYFAYPRLDSLPKLVLVIIGFIYGVIYFGIKISIEHILLFIYILIMFDILACQARFQLNDIRGIEEDINIGRKNRLISDDIENKGHVIKVSIKIAFIKIIIAITMAVMYGGPAHNLCILCLGILFMISLLYEFVRYRKSTKWIFCLVGAGYPLRFFVGMIALSPININSSATFPIFCFMASLWLCGSFASILSWINEITDWIQESEEESEGEGKELNISKFKFKKEHYNFLLSKIADQYSTAKKCMVNNKVLPLRESGKIRDPWNFAFLLSMGFLAASTLFMRLSYKYVIIELLCFLSFLIMIYLKRKNKLYAFTFGIGVIIFKIMWHPLDVNIPVDFILISITQLWVAGAYYLLSYRPQFKSGLKDSLKNVYGIVCLQLFGKYAIDEIKKAEQERMKRKS